MGLPLADPGPVDRWKIRETLGISDGEILMMHLGFLTPEKGLGAILGGLAAARSGGVNARLVLVGEDAGGAELKTAAESLGVGAAVTSTGWLPWDQMITVPAAADVGVVLRVPSAGETSAAVIRFLACGTPAAVIAQRQFLEWPEAAAPRITPGPPMTAEIARLLRRVSEDVNWKDRRTAARAAYEDGHTPEHAAKAMVNFLASLEV
jgi:glycosyltransferase involved in cell wall biosynthesis